MIKIHKKVRDWMIPVSLTLFAYVILKFVLLIGYVPSASMTPTLPERSLVIGCRWFEDLQVGDIIIFERDGVLMVKRIAAVPGERLDLRKLKYMTSVPIPVWEDPIIQIPENCYFVLGDNSENSWDSRYWEDPYVRLDTIRAKIWIRN